MMAAYLSEKARKNLRRNEEFRNKASKYVRLEDGEEVILEFDAEDIDPVERVWDGQKKLRFMYACTNELGNTQFFPACKKTSREIDGHLANGETRLKVKRRGLGLETSYVIDSCVKV